MLCNISRRLLPPALHARSFWSRTSSVAKHAVRADSPPLVTYFDLPATAATSQSTQVLSPTGVFGQRLLTSPSGLAEVAAHVERHCNLVLRRIHAAPAAGQGELRLVVKNFDRLSDLLCGVIDMCELLWTTHPDRKWVAQAEKTYEGLCRLMNQMNVDEALYGALKAAMDDPSITEAFTAEEARAAYVFMHDFQKSGIHLPARDKQTFVNLSEQIIVLGRQFATDQGSPAPPVIFPDVKALLPGLGDRFVRRVRGRRGDAKVQPGTYESAMILRKAENEEVRRRMWIGGQTANRDQISVLEQLLSTRARLAGLVGRGSWGEVELENKMASSPANVTGFLESLALSNRPAALSEISKLAALKQEQHSLSSLPNLQPWDRDYYLQMHADHLAASTGSLDSLSPYFSVGNVLNGLSTLFTKLYGVSFVPAPAAPGEVWHNSVRKLEVVDEAEGGVVGYIYCDLFSRDGKAGNAAHYTVRCSRRVDDDDLAGDLKFSDDPSFDPRRGGLEVTPSTARSREGWYQLPIVVLNCNFEEPTFEAGATLLSWQEVETIFHEMGHAMHSMIGRTALHNVSGTRVPTDLAELPSIFMENFSSSPLLLPSLVSHHETGLPPPKDLILAHQAQRSHFPHLENSTQIYMALLDQRLHSLSPSATDSVDSTSITHALTDAMGLFPSVPGTAPQTQFGHLNGYGASYYSYLFDRAIAGRVWDVVFQQGEGGIDSLREGGERFKGELLRWGGGRDPWEMVAGVLGDEELRAGDKRAMERVGQWGVDR